MPKIVHQDFYFTIWSFQEDIFFQDHFNKVGFSKIFRVDCPEVKDAMKIENMGTIYKFKSVEQLKKEMFETFLPRLPMAMAAPGDIQATPMTV